MYITSNIENVFIGYLKDVVCRMCILPSDILLPFCFESGEQTRLSSTVWSKRSSVVVLQNFCFGFNLSPFFKINVIIGFTAVKVFGSGSLVELLSRQNLRAFSKSFRIEPIGIESGIPGILIALLSASVSSLDKIAVSFTSLIGISSISGCS